MDAYQAASIRPLILLGFGNELYTGRSGIAPTTADQREAFCNYAIACIRRYRNRGIIFELWNEPNFAKPIPPSRGLQTWEPKANVTQYMEVGRLSPHQCFLREIAHEYIPPAALPRLASAAC